MNGGMKMTDDQYPAIIEELESSLKELESADTSHPIVRKMIEDEIRDVRYALGRADMNSFATCEMSGELIPFELMKMNPTSSTLQEMNDWRKYGKVHLHL